MTPIDVLIVSAYVVGLFTVGILVGLRETAEDFLVLSRRAGFFLVLASVVSSWVGVGMFVGTTASLYQTGISLGLTGAAGAVVAILAAAVFAPRVKEFGDAYQAHTLGDFLAVRYSSSVRRVAAAVIVTVYLLLTAVQFTGMSALLQVWSGVGFTAAMVVTALSTILYTAFAGIKSDFYTDAIHFVVMIIVLFGLLLPRLWVATGSFHAVSVLPSRFFEPFAFGGVEYFIGGLILGVAIVFVSMDIWQRIYASSSAATARAALMTAGVIIVPYYALAVAIGLGARALMPNVANPNLVLFLVMRQYLPTGLLGLGIAAFIALFVSAANTMMMVVSATLTKDVISPQFMGRDSVITGSRLLLIGRAATVVTGFGGLLLSLAIRSIVTLSVVAIFFLLVLLPAVLGGFYRRRATAKGALWSIVGGSAAYALALPWSPTNAFLPGFVVSAALFVVVSLLTADGSPRSVRV